MRLGDRTLLVTSVPLWRCVNQACRMYGAPGGWIEWPVTERLHDMVKVAPSGAATVPFAPAPKPATGTFLAMPLLRNVPVGRPDWVPVHCPYCYTLCWRGSQHDEALRLHPDYLPACTSCALQASVWGRR